MTARKLPIGIQSFEKIRTEEYLYVDKTEYIWNLVEQGVVYFLSRPRRFGKSLLISTMEAYFRGQKELFHGLAIEALENGRGKDAWTEYPVIRFSLSGGEYHAADGLSQTLSTVLRRYESSCGILPENMDLPNRFRVLLERLYDKTGRPVVVLVDEYDKPLLGVTDGDREAEERNRQLYKGFFSVLKDEDQYLKFVFFTGVTKFSKVSIFSDLNQLNDISLDEEVAGICGITEAELTENFTSEIREVADYQGISKEDCLARLASTYDGYHFSQHGTGVYNPFSLLNAFSKKDFRYYWFETGTPTYLIRKLQASTLKAEDLSTGVKATEMQLLDYRIEDSDPIPLFYQSGYLTIAGFDREFRVYSLEFPNDEVRYGFLNSLAPVYLGMKDTETPLSAMNMIMAIRRGDLEAFMERLKALFAGIPYIEGDRPSYEQEWRNEIYLILKLLGQNVACEVHTAEGRCDCILETKDSVYIFEYKLDQPAEAALSQIRDKGYDKLYTAGPKRVVRVGVSFSSEKRNITDWMSVEDGIERI